MIQYNFAAGPSMTPQTVEAQVAADMVDFRGTGFSVLQVGHRSRIFEKEMLGSAEANFRFLLKVPDDYVVLFLQGGATAQFSGVPMNLVGHLHALVDYVDTGIWSQKAMAEAKKYAKVHVAASSREHGYQAVPTLWHWRPESAYMHYCANETIGGVQFHRVPTAGIPLVCDMSSDILSRPIDVSRYGLIYAGAQKNMGIPGVTIVIVREDLLGRALEITPSVLNYTLQAQAGSMLNTPPTHAIYVAGLMFQWIKAQGGLEAMEQENRFKANLLYATIDGSGGFYTNPVEPSSRSLMNVPFLIHDPSLEAKFLGGAAERGLMNLEGHRSVGGLRASIYNAMPRLGVHMLVEYMRYFANEHG